jgi:hypothetical protein
MRCKALERELAALARALRSPHVQEYFREEGEGQWRRFMLLRIQLSGLACEWRHAAPEAVSPAPLEARAELWRAVNAMFFALERRSDPDEIVSGLERIVSLIQGEVGLVL